MPKLYLLPSPTGAVRVRNTIFIDNLVEIAVELRLFVEHHKFRILTNNV